MKLLQFIQSVSIEHLEKISAKFKMQYPSEYRFLITNDFYEYVTSQHRAEITTMTGNDDMLKFNTLW